MVGSNPNKLHKKKNGEENKPFSKLHYFFLAPRTNLT